MTSSRRRIVWLLLRLVVYVTVAAILIQTRGHVDWRHLFSRARTIEGGTGRLHVCGRDVAPDLIGRLTAWYRQDYPNLEVTLDGGGTHQALEELMNRRTDVAFLSRPVSAAEQRLFQSATGDTALVWPVALGGLVFLTADRSDLDSLGAGDLRRRLSGRDPGAPEHLVRLYAPDPNSGLWAALALRLGVPQAAGPPDRVTFLKDEPAVIEAVRVDVGTIGLVSSLDLPDEPGRPGVRVVRVAPDSIGAPAVEPGCETIATGQYPLYHYLYVACRPGGGIEGDKFVTHLTSARGQRQVERSGQLPARQVPREVILSTGTPGGGPTQTP